MVLAAGDLDRARLAEGAPGHRVVVDELGERGSHLVVAAVRGGLTQDGAELVLLGADEGRRRVVRAGVGGEGEGAEAEGERQAERGEAEERGAKGHREAVKVAEASDERPQLSIAGGGRQLHLPAPWSAPFRERDALPRAHAA